MTTSEETAGHAVDDEQVPKAVRAAVRGTQPRRFALCETSYRGVPHPEPRIYAWGLDFTEHGNGHGPGALFVGDGGWYGSADSAEGALEMCSIIRTVRLVWL